MMRLMPPKQSYTGNEVMNVNAVERAKLLDFDARLKKEKKKRKGKSLVCKDK